MTERYEDGQGGIQSKGKESRREGGLYQGQAGRDKSKGEQLGGAVRTFELRWEEPEMDQKDLGIDQKGG